MSSLDQLNDTCPAWANIFEVQRRKLRVLAVAQQPSGLTGRSYFLFINLRRDNLVAVFEEPDGHLPLCCVERHINPDASFCLHYNSTEPVQSAAMAREWWRSLGFYLNNQDYASRRRKWPMLAQLSHGDAAITQIQMEELAEPLGWKEEEVLAAIFRKRGWLGGRLPRLSKDKSSLVNLRSPCPRGCTRKHHPFRKSSCERLNCAEGCRRLHKPTLRADCPNRSVVESLVLLEHQRRAQEHEFFKSLKNSQVICCGTMDNCSLRQEEISN
ncbi:MAG: hypothetical protein F4103_17490 [Boseongicola sp. SB0673_bin_14]|nr:hypothetical protein [Boseongicola sp. SB0673_bin_14]